MSGKMMNDEEGSIKTTYEMQKTEVSEKLARIIKLRSFGLLAWVVLVGIYYQIDAMNNYLALAILHLVVLSIGTLIFRLQNSINKIELEMQPTPEIDSNADKDEISPGVKSLSRNNFHHALFLALVYAASILVIFTKVGFHIPDPFGRLQDSVFTIVLTIFTLFIFRCLKSLNKLSKE